MVTEKASASGAGYPRDRLLVPAEVAVIRGRAERPGWCAIARAQCDHLGESRIIEDGPLTVAVAWVGKGGIGAGWRETRKADAGSSAERLDGAARGGIVYPAQRTEPRASVAHDEIALRGDPRLGGRERLRGVSGIGGAGACEQMAARRLDQQIKRGIEDGGRELAREQPLRALARAARGGEAVVAPQPRPARASRSRSTSAKPEAGLSTPMSCPRSAVVSETPWRA